MLTNLKEGNIYFDEAIVEPDMAIRTDTNYVFHAIVSTMRLAHWAKVMAFAVVFARCDLEPVTTELAHPIVIAFYKLGNFGVPNQARNLFTQSFSQFAHGNVNGHGPS